MMFLSTAEMAPSTVVHHAEGVAFVIQLQIVCAAQCHEGGFVKKQRNNFVFVENLVHSYDTS
jgi:hypothetical protein